MGGFVVTGLLDALAARELELKGVHHAGADHVPGATCVGGCTSMMPLLHEKCRNLIVYSIIP